MLLGSIHELNDVGTESRLPETDGKGCVDPGLSRLLDPIDYDSKKADLLKSQMNQKIEELLL